MDKIIAKSISNIYNTAKQRITSNMQWAGQQAQQNIGRPVQQTIQNVGNRVSSNLNLVAKPIQNQVKHDMGQLSYYQQQEKQNKLQPSTMLSATTPVGQIGRALRTDYETQINKVLSGNFTSNPTLNRVTSNIGLVAKPVINTALDYVAPKFTPEELALIKKIKVRQKLTPQEAQLADSMATRNTLNIGLSMSGVKNIDKAPTKFNTNAPAQLEGRANPLLSEAKKYKSAEEFASSQLSKDKNMTIRDRGDINRRIENDVAMSNSIQKSINKERDLIVKNLVKDGRVTVTDNLIPTNKNSDLIIDKAIESSKEYKDLRVKQQIFEKESSKIDLNKLQDEFTQLTDIWNKANKGAESKLTPNLKVTDAYGKTNMGYNIQGMEKRANETGYNLYDALIKRVDSQTTVDGKRAGMESIMDDLWGKANNAPVGKVPNAIEAKTNIEQPVSQGVQPLGTSIPETKPKTKLLGEIDDLKKQIGQVKTERQKNIAEAQLRAGVTGDAGFTNQDRTRFGQLKSMMEKADQELGSWDVEKLKSKNKTLVNWATERWREINPQKANLTDDELINEIYDFTKNNQMSGKVKVRTPQDSADLKQLGQKMKDMKEKVKQVYDLVYNSETDPNIKANVIKNNEKILKQNAELEYREWQSAVLKQTNQESTVKTNQALDTITGAIKQNTQPSYTRDITKLKDISGFYGGMRDVYRNFKAAFGEKFPEVKRQILNPFDASKGRMMDDLDTWAGKLNKEVETDLGIKAGSKQSAAVQEFGEGSRDLASLVKEFGKEQADKIVKADKWFRGNYDTLLDEVNAIRSRIYPNDPTKIIPKRQDYYRHFRDISKGFQGLVNIFETPANISSSLSGVSEYTKPRSKWLSFAQKRLGVKSDVDAVGGFVDYLKSWGYAKNIDPHIPKFRNLATQLMEQTAEGTPQAGNLNNFIEFLNDFSNDLSGKTNPLDRAAQKWIPGGRKTFSVINWLNSRVKANVILGNVSSTVAQIFNVPQGIASAGPKYSVKGIGKTLASMFTKNEPMAQSSFIKERYFNAFDKFDRGMIANVKKGAAWLTQVLDEVGTKYIWNSHYEKALGEGIPNPVKYADDLTRQMVAGRGIGEVPLVQKSRLFQVIAPFQLEVSNLWYVMKDFVDEKAFGKIATLFVANYLFNRGAEAIRGSDVTFDPIQATLEALDTFGKEEDKKVGALKAGGRLAGEVLGNVPFGQSVAAAYPEYGFQVGDSKAPTRKALFGKGDPTRFGSGLVVTKGLQDPLFKILPPFGGQQIKRTIEGLGAVNKGYSESASGRIQYPIRQTPVNYLRGATFGKGSTQEAKEYFKNESSVLGEKQSNAVRESSDKIGTYNKIMTKRATDKQIDKAREQAKVTNKTQTVGTVYVIPQPDGTTKTVDMAKQIPKPDLSGSLDMDKMEVTKFKSAITRQAGDIQDLYKAGQIDLQTAITKIADLKSQTAQLPTFTVKKPKKITSIKVKKAPSIKIKRPKKLKYKKPKKFKGLKPVKWKTIKLKRP